MIEHDASEKANVLLGEAVLLRAKKKPKEAMAKCQEALRALPENAEAFEILGDLYSEAGLTEAAIEAYKRVQELDASRNVVETKIARAALEKDRLSQQWKTTHDLLEGRISPARARNPATAGLLSLLLPGLGQAYNRQWLKAAALICVDVMLFMGAIAAVLRILLLETPSSDMPVLDIFGAIEAFFIPPALFWTLLLSLLYIYSVIDAALSATRSPAEETGLV